MGNPSVVRVVINDMERHENISFMSSSTPSGPLYGLRNMIDDIMCDICRRAQSSWEQPKVSRI